MKFSFKKIKVQSRNVLSFQNINPHMHWNKLLIFFLLLIFILVLFSFYILYKIKNQQIFQIEPKSDESPTLINENLLEEVNKRFEQKEFKSNEIKNGLKLYKDPSI